MNSNVNDRKSNRMKLAWGALMGAVLTMPGRVLADLPLANTVADGASTTSPIEASRNLATSGITIAGTVVAAALVLGGAWQIYASFVKGREKGDWKDFGVTTFVGAGVMAGGVILAILAVQYGTFA